MKKNLKIIGLCLFFAWSLKASDAAPSIPAIDDLENFFVWILPKKTGDPVWKCRLRHYSSWADLKKRAEKILNYQPGTARLMLYELNIRDGKPFCNKINLTDGKGGAISLEDVAEIKAKIKEKTVTGDPYSLVPEIHWEDTPLEGQVDRKE
jgi:hypothetical protein